MSGSKAVAGVPSPGRLCQRYDMAWHAGQGNRNAASAKPFELAMFPSLGPGWLGARGARRWLWLGRCPVCGTSVLLDDEFVRVRGAIRHAECDRHVREIVRTRLSAR